MEFPKVSPTDFPLTSGSSITDGSLKSRRSRLFISSLTGSTASFLARSRDRLDSKVMGTSEARSRVLVFMRSAVLIFSAVTLCAQDALEIVRKSVETDQISWQRAKDYAWVRRVETHIPGSKARNTSRTFESFVLYGLPYNRLVAKNDQPLSSEEQKKEQEKLDKASVERQHVSAERMAKREKARQRQREFLRELPEVYDFKLEGQDVVDGHEVWVISAVPKPGYKPRDNNARPLLKFRGKLWIDKSEYQWVRMQAEVMEPLTWGLFLIKLNPGSSVMFEQTRVNDEIWLPKHRTIRLAARLLFKHVDEEQDITFRDYRKFQADSKVVGTSEAK